MDKSLLSVALIAACSLSMGAMQKVDAGASPVKIVEIAGSKSGIKSVPVDFAGVKKLRLGSLRSEGSTLPVGISVEGMGETVVVWSENFDGGAVPEGWNIDPTTKVTWLVKKKSGNPFSAIDTEDNGSLVQDTPYRFGDRETSSATTPAFAVGQNALLEGYIGFSLNYEDMCSMVIYASDDDFATQTALWRSVDQTGEKPWAWRKIQVSLDAFAGKTIKLRFTYGPGTDDDMFKLGGYMGDYYIDGLKVTEPGRIESLDLMTGETVKFIAMTDSDVAEFEWSFPGGVPASSTDANPTVYYTVDGTYDVSLTVRRGGESATETRQNFVTVTGTAPVAHIGYPATFRDASTRLPMVAPMNPVTFTDASTGFPTEWTWGFSGVMPDRTQQTVFQTQDAVVRYDALHSQPVLFGVENQHGLSLDQGSVAVEYSGAITNFREGDYATSFDLDGEGSFPGSNKLNITAYAEKFSAPSVPARIYGAYVYFLKAFADELYEQIQDVKVSLCKADENGMPGEVLDWESWRVFELDLPSDASSLTGTEFTFSSNPVVTGDFFIKIEGIPEYSDVCHVAFAMAGFRDSGNTAYMLKDGKWMSVADYFPAGQNHTSYLVTPLLAHSVMSGVVGTVPTDNTVVTVGSAAGTATYDFFSYLGRTEDVEIDQDWCRVTNAPGEYTVDQLEIAYDELPAALSERQANITITDGVTKLTVTLQQSRTDAVDAIDIDEAFSDEDAVYFNLQGIRVPAGSLTPGLYIRRTQLSVEKVVVR